MPEIRTYVVEMTQAVRIQATSVEDAAQQGARAIRDLHQSYLIVTRSMNVKVET